MKALVYVLYDKKGRAARKPKRIIGPLEYDGITAVVGKYPGRAHAALCGVSLCYIHDNGFKLRGFEVVGPTEARRIYQEWTVIPLSAEQYEQHMERAT